MNERRAAVDEYLSSGAYLDLAGFICANEMRSLKIDTEHRVNWEPKQGDGKMLLPLALENVKLSNGISRANEGLEVVEVRFHLFGDNESIVSVTDLNEDFIRQDPLSLDTIGEFGSVYKMHMHDVCLRAARQKLIEEKRHKRLQEKLEKHKTKEQENIAVVDKRRIA